MKVVIYKNPNGDTRLEITPEILDKAMRNTVKMIDDMTEVK